ncbi:methoxymalonate biosynthesis acyl carrier protein [Sphingomonas sp. SORGH_AS 950]|uniref:acyl carrier protein n=1 Tax=Sphingomonas sp. SORGH_AS_0950 TaxID=3041792 RepID=UPI0027820216|nr:acyl carrier protein [Sphingomonas sp. SORGH_AS_0950]MDQ1159620.1 methoxymalonate biosynthesis acyl carrier protein [Sphingomonas sp. SORGH_AS_0950]
MNTRERIKSYIEGVVMQLLDDDEDIFELGLVDSLFGLQLVSFVEQEFGLEVDGDDLDIDNFCSIAALDRFVNSKIIPSVER